MRCFEILRFLLRYKLRHKSSGENAFFNSFHAITIFPPSIVLSNWKDFHLLWSEKVLSCCEKLQFFLDSFSESFIQLLELFSSLLLTLFEGFTDADVIWIDFGRIFFDFKPKKCLGEAVDAKTLNLKIASKLSNVSIFIIKLMDGWNSRLTIFCWWLQCYRDDCQQLD